MSDKISDIRHALIDAYTAVGLGLPTTYDNVRFEPNAGEAFAIIQFLPVQPIVGSLGDGGLDELLGILQIDICTPLDEGESVALGHADALRAYFTAGRVFEHDTQCVTISNCGQSQGFVFENYFRMPNSVSWQSRLARAIN